jgi:YVTN family beta-propeller protein
LAYVTTGYTDVSVIDTASNIVTTMVPVGLSPSGVAITPDGAFAYVANFDSDNVSVIDTATNTVTTTVTVGEEPVGVAITPDGAFAYVTNSRSDVSVIDTASNIVTATVTVGSFPVGVAITPDGAFAYVTNAGSDDVSVIDTASNTVTSTVAVGSFPFGVAITPGPAADPSALLQQLRDDATGKGPGTSLADKIAVAQTYFAVPDIQATCAVLDAFINQVNVLLKGKKPRGATAQLITDANAIKIAIGCP